jgi:hypothetical protein
MPKEDLAPYQRNLALKQAFADLHLDLAAVMEFTPLDLDLENSRLESLFSFVLDYRRLGGRTAMEGLSGGMLFPPIFPGISPENDWYRFEEWIQGNPVRASLADQLAAQGSFRPPGEIAEADIVAELDRLVEAFERAEYGISLNEGIPARLVYAFLFDMLKETFELFGKGGGWFVDGCTGYCPGCFQRPWCSTGNSSCWNEDEAAGKMYLTEAVRRYVSASSQSLAILRALQAEEDAFFARYRAENPTIGPSDQQADADRKARFN